MLTTGWEEATAIGTIAVAVVTGGLAASTRKLAKEASRETRTNWAPVLMIDAPAEDDGTSEALRLEDNRLFIDLVNVGRGPALKVTVYLDLDEKDDAGFPKIARGHAVRDVVAPDGNLTLRWRDFKAPVPPSPTPFQAWAALNGKVTYADVAYMRYETEFTLGFRIDGAVAVLDQRYLGAYIDRIGWVERLQWKRLRVLYALQRRLPRRLQRLALRLARPPRERPR